MRHLPPVRSVLMQLSKRQDRPSLLGQRICDPCGTSYGGVATESLHLVSDLPAKGLYHIPTRPTPTGSSRIALSIHTEAEECTCVLMLLQDSRNVLQSGNRDRRCPPLPLALVIGQCHLPMSSSHSHNDFRGRDCEVIVGRHKDPSSTLPISLPTLIVKL